MTDETLKWEGVTINISKGDIIKSKTGLLSKSPMTGKFYRWKHGEYLGSGHWRVIGDKEEMDIKECDNSD